MLWLSEGKLIAQGSAQEVVRRYLNAMVHGVDEAKAESDESPQSRPAAQAAVQWSAVTERNSTEGGGKGKITHVRVLVGAGQSQALVENKRTQVVVEAILEIREPLSEPSFAVGVLNSLNEPVVHFNTQNTGNRLPAFASSQGKLRIRAQFSLPPLRPGDYLMAVGLDNGTVPYHELVHHVYDAAEISVRPTADTSAQSGYVQVEDATVTVEQF